MQRKFWMAAAWVALLAGISVRAGVVIEQRVVSDGVTAAGKSQPPRKEMQTLLLEEDRLALDRSGHSAIIVRRDQGKVFLVNHARKTYSVLALPVAFPADVAKVFKGLRFTTDVRRTGETATVGPYRCTKVVVKTSGYLESDMVLWCTADLPVPVERYYEMAATAAAFSPALAEMNEKLKALGQLFPVRVENRVNIFGASNRTVTETVRVDAAVRIDESRFLPPPGYAEEPIEFSPAGR